MYLYVYIMVKMMKIPCYDSASGSMHFLYYNTFNHGIKVWLN